MREPNRWISARQSAVKPIYSIGYNQILLFGIYKFHKTREDEQGLAWMNTLFARHADKLTTQHRIDDALHRYQEYVEWCRANQLAVSECRVTLRGEFNSFFTLGGFLHRVDTDAVGVRGVILGEYQESWRQELRMPLIQSALASRYRLDAGDVSVGVQQLDGGGFRQHRYSAARLRTARAEFQAIGEYVRTRLGLLRRTP